MSKEVWHYKQRILRALIIQLQEYPATEAASIQAHQEVINDLRKLREQPRARE